MSSTASDTKRHAKALPDVLVLAVGWTARSASSADVGRARCKEKAQSAHGGVVRMYGE